MKKNMLQVNNNEPPLSLIRERILQNSHPKRMNGSGRSACVFLLLQDKGGEYVIPGILKADNKGYPWANQVALPGGLIDRTDSGPKDAAYRELQEELSITPPHVDYFGSMGHYPTINNTDIEVFTGFWDGQESIVYDESEIARVIDIPLSSLLETHTENGYGGRVPGWDELLYPVEDVVIWGATARIMHYFIELVFEPPAVIQK